MKSNMILALIISSYMNLTSVAENAIYTIRRADENETTTVSPQSIANFYWKDSYLRGIGKVSCPEGQSRIGLFCYPDCPTGYSRFGFDCYSTCPSGLRDDGLFCRNAEYGRGIGYLWKVGDGTNDRGMYERCEAEEGRGNCEKYGLAVYPKCREGFESFGCCICRPAVPDCEALGLNKGIDLSCTKKIILGKPSLGECSADEESDAGLCYPNCRDGFNGIGPLCLGDVPSGWVDCGLGGARDKNKCASTVADQVVSAGNVIAFAASLGTSGTAKVLTAPVEASKLQSLKAAWDKFKDLKEVKTAKELYDKANAAKDTYVNIDDLLSQDSITTEDYIRMAASMSAVLDPTGISSVVASYVYPKCDKIVG